MDKANTPVCIIEDNIPIRKLFTTLLKKAGFQTVDFPNGTSGVEWVKQNKCLAMIVDILLPDLSGSDILKIVRELPEGDKIPVIAVTGFAQVNDKEKYIEMGFDFYIAKPVDTDTFASDIEAVISAKQ